MPHFNLSSVIQVLVRASPTNWMEKWSRNNSQYQDQMHPIATYTYMQSHECVQMKKKTLNWLGLSEDQQETHKLQK